MLVAGKAGPCVVSALLKVTCETKVSEEELSEMTTGQTHGMIRAIPPDHFTLWTTEGIEQDGGPIAVDMNETGITLETTPEALRRVGYVRWFTVATALVIYTGSTGNTGDTGDTDGGEQTQGGTTRASYPFCAVLTLGGRVRLIAFERLRDVGAFCGEWLPVLKAVGETNQ